MKTNLYWAVVSNLCLFIDKAFRVFDKIQTVDAGAIVENKRLGAVLALVKQQQAAHRGPPVALAGGRWVLLLLFRAA